MLNPRRKISKKEIKEDALVTYYVKAQKLFQAYGKQINIGLIAVAAIVVIGVMMGRSKRQSELAAASQVSMPERLYFAQQYQNAIPGFQSVIDSYPGTRAAGKAIFYLANVYFESNDLENAALNYRNYIDKYGHVQLFTVSSIAGVAACFENQGQFAQAAEWYEKAFRKNTESFKAPFYLKDAGRCYVSAGNKERGREMYKRVKEEYPQSGVSNDVDVLIHML